MLGGNARAGPADEDIDKLPANILRHVLDSSVLGHDTSHEEPFEIVDR